MATTNTSKDSPETEMDRFSDLPGSLIHHILSFAEANLAVQMCLLSKRWLLLWTCLPVLNFDIRSFPTNHAFNEFVGRVLCNLRALKFHSLSLNKSVLDTVIGYAVSHSVQEIDIMHRLNYLPDELLCCVTLRSLHLERCKLYDDHFSRCMNLETLTLVKCYMLQDEKIIISTPRLVKLTICNFEDRFFLPLELKVKISCPRLSSFWYEGRCHELSLSGDSLGFSMDGCPVLERMEIRISGSYKEIREAIDCFLWLKQMLQVMILHAKSLVVRKNRLMIKTMLSNDDIPAIVFNEATSERGECVWRHGTGQDFEAFVRQIVRWFDDQIWIEESTPGEFAAIAEAELSDMELKLQKMVSLLQRLGIQVPEEPAAPSNESRETFVAKYSRVQLQKQRIMSILERQGIPAPDSWNEIKNRFFRYRGPGFWKGSSVPNKLQS